MVADNSTRHKSVTEATPIEPGVDLPFPLTPEGQEASCPRCGVTGPIDRDTQTCLYCWFSMSWPERQRWRARVVEVAKAAPVALAFWGWVGWLVFA